MPGVGFMVRVVGLGSNNPELKSCFSVELLPVGVDSACHPSEVSKMSASLLLSRVGVVTCSELCPIAEKTASAAPMLCTEYGPDGWIDGMATTAMGTSVVLGMLSIQPPCSLDLHTAGLPGAWKKWKESMELYLDLAMAGLPKEEKKVKMILYLNGTEGMLIYNTISLGYGDRSSIEQVMEAFDNPRPKETVQRYKFFTKDQHRGEIIDTYVTELHV